MKSFLKSFTFAHNGLTSALIEERNFRVQWLCAVFVCTIFSLLSFSQPENFMALLFVFLVLALELLNCAIEKICDLNGKKFCEIKKRTKDFSAASVLLVSTGAAIFFIYVLYLKIPHAILFWQSNAKVLTIFLVLFFANFFLNFSKNFLSNHLLRAMASIAVFLCQVWLLKISHNYLWNLLAILFYGPYFSAHLLSLNLEKSNTVLQK